MTWNNKQNDCNGFRSSLTDHYSLLETTTSRLIYLFPIPFCRLVLKNVVRIMLNSLEKNKISVQMSESHDGDFHSSFVLRLNSREQLFSEIPASRRP